MTDTAEPTQSVDPVADAAQWLATGGADRTKAVVPQLRKRYGLTAAEAISAIRQSYTIKAGAH